jgi:hypothetical protein
MSSTSRGAERHPDDFYATPEWATLALLRVLGPHAPGRILEPTAGTGAIVRALRKHWPGCGVTANEIDAERAELLHDAGAKIVKVTDFLVEGFLGQDLIITNPPFKLAMPIIERSRQIAREVALLLRLNFLGSQERAAFWHEHPADVYVLPRRPSFAASLKCKKKCGWATTLPLDAERPKVCPACSAAVTVTTSDSCEYAWFVWGPGRGGRWQVLDLGEEAAA